METENTNQSNKFSNPSNHVKKDLNGIWVSISQFLYGLLDIKKDTDKKGTIEDIKGNISMKGHTAWVLVFSILIVFIVFPI